MNTYALDKLVMTAVNERKLPSVSAAFGTADTVLYRRSYGFSRCFADAAPVIAYPPQKLTQPVSVTDTTLYDMASLTKVMSTTMIAFQLLQKGEILPDDTLSRFIDAPEDKKNITLRQLMTHTSGMVPAVELEKTDPDPANVLKTILGLELRDKPGNSVAYSCMGYITLAKILEQVAGAKLDVLFDTLVAKPLGLTSSGYCPLEKGYTDIACTEYRPEYGKYLCGVVHDENARFQGGVSGNAGLYSNLDDAIRFAQMLLRGGEGFICPSLLKEATRCWTVGLGEARGLGFHINRQPQASPNRDSGPAGDLFSDGAFGHTGYTGTNLFVDPEKGYFTILLTNRVHMTRSCDAHLRLRRAFTNAAVAAAEQANA